MLYTKRCNSTRAHAHVHTLFLSLPLSPCRLRCPYLLEKYLNKVFICIFVTAACMHCTCDVVYAMCNVITLATRREKRFAEHYNAGRSVSTVWIILAQVFFVSCDMASTRHAIMLRTFNASYVSRGKSCAMHHRTLYSL